MNGQLDLLARLSDPSTSKQAAKGDRSTLELRVLDAVRAAGRHGATAAEAHQALVAAGWSVKENSVSRRLTTLARAERVELAGTRGGQRAWRVPAYMAGGAA